MLRAELAVLIYGTNDVPDYSTLYEIRPISDENWMNILEGRHMSANHTASVIKRDSDSQGDHYENFTWYYGKYLVLTALIIIIIEAFFDEK